MRLWAVASLVGLQALGASGVVAAVAAPSTVCDDEVARQRVAWRVAGPPRPQPPTRQGDTVSHWPTDTLGVWVVETRATADGGVSLQRVTSSGVLEVAWSPRCQASTTERRRGSSAGATFTDGDLQRLLQESPQGLIYVWSPHMPLSVDGVSTIRTLGTQLQLPVIVLLDGHASRSAARAALEANAWPAAYGRVADSVELTFRDVLLHAPSLQAFASGRLVGSPLPGCRTLDEYDAFVQRVLTGAH